MKHLPVFNIIILLVLSCSSSTQWGYRAAERADVDIVGNRAALMRTLYCDIYVENLTGELRQILYDSDIYRGRGKGMPLEPCFQFIVLNTWKRPIVIEKIVLRYDNEEFEPELYEYVNDPGYTEKRFAVNLNKMMQNRRLLTEDELIDEIDYDTETVEYRSGFIAPGDRVLFYRFFPFVPHRKGVKMFITIKYFEMKKIIDFDMTRFDYTE